MPRQPRKPTELHAKCKHPWYPGVPFCLACYCQHTGPCHSTVPKAAQWACLDGLGTWATMKDIAAQVGYAIAALGNIPADRDTLDDYEREAA